MSSQSHTQHNIQTQNQKSDNRKKKKKKKVPLSLITIRTLQLLSQEELPDLLFSACAYHSFGARTHMMTLV